MVTYKSPEDIEHLAEGGMLLAQVLEEIVQAAKVGTTTQQLDQLVQRRIKEVGCVPSFLNYAPGNHDPFPAALCTSVNHGLVHGLPNDTPLVEGDVLGLDLGLIYQNKYYLDHARTICVGSDIKGAQQLIDVTTESLNRGIAAAQVGNTIGDIGHAVQSYAEGEGFSIVRQLVGHGVGFGVHEEPQVPNYGNPGQGLTIKPGLIIAIEPMLTSGDPSVITGNDGWTVETKSGALAAHQEHTVAITESGPQILTATSP